MRHVRLLSGNHCSSAAAVVADACISLRHLESGPYHPLHVDSKYNKRLTMKLLLAAFDGRIRLGISVAQPW